MPRRRRNGNNSKNIVIKYTGSGCVLGLFIGLIGGFLTLKYMFWWIDYNVSWENQDVGDGVAAIGSAVVIFVWCTIIGAVVGLIIGQAKEDNRKNNKRNK